MKIPPLLAHTAVLLIVATLLAACSNQADTGVAPVEISQDSSCALDGMLLADYPGPKAQIHYDGTPEPEFFCDTSEMFSLLLKPEQARMVTIAYVQDMDKADWAAPKGAWIDAKGDGSPVTQADRAAERLLRELIEAELIVNLCERFGCLPSALLEEDPALLRMVRLVDLAHPRPEVAGDGSE